MYKEIEKIKNLSDEQLLSYIIDCVKKVESKEKKNILYFQEAEKEMRKRLYNYRKYVDTVEGALA